MSQSSSIQVKNRNGKIFFVAPFPFFTAVLHPFWLNFPSDCVIEAGNERGKKCARRRRRATWGKKEIVKQRERKTEWWRIYEKPGRWKLERSHTVVVLEVWLWGGESCCYSWGYADELCFFWAGSVICCHLPLPQKNWEWRLLKETFSFSYMTITWTSWSFDWRLKEKLLLRLLWGIRTGHYFKTFPKQTTSSFFVLYSIEMIGVKLITWQMTCKLQNMCIGNVFRWFEFWVSYKTAVTSSEKHNRAGPLTAPSAFDRSAALFIHVPLRSAGATKRRSSST